MEGEGLNRLETRTRVPNVGRALLPVQANNHWTGRSARPTIGGYVNLLSIFIVWLLATWCQAQSFDGLVKPVAYPAFEGKPIEVRITGQRESQVGELQRLVTLRNNDQLVGIEFTVNRSPRKVKPEQIESLKIDSRPYSLKLHVPTKQYVLIDSITARGEATARMAKRNAQWVDLLSEAEFQNATLQSMNLAKKYRDPREILREVWWKIDSNSSAQYYYFQTNIWRMADTLGMEAIRNTDELIVTVVVGLIVRHEERPVIPY